jgi:hypothetical protein
MSLIGMRKPLREEYKQYWKEHFPTCVGHTAIKISRWKRHRYTVHCNGESRSVAWYWSYVPDKFITYNDRGLKWNISLTNGK